MWSSAVILTLEPFFVLFLIDGAAEIVSSVEVHEAVGLASDDRIRITYDV